MKFEYLNLCYIFASRCRQTPVTNGAVEPLAYDLVASLPIPTVASTEVTSLKDEALALTITYFH